MMFPEKRRCTRRLKVIRPLVNKRNCLLIQRIILLTLVFLFIPTGYAATGRNNNKIRHHHLPNHNQLARTSKKVDTTSSKNDSIAIQLSSVESSRCLINASTPEEPKYFFYGDQELAIGILVSDRLTHKLASNVLKVFAEEILGYVNVTLVYMIDPTQGFDPDAQFSYISSCTDPR